MDQCKECEMAIYCYSEASTWVFRTTQEMEEKTATMTNCPIHSQVRTAYEQNRREAKAG